MFRHLFMAEFNDDAGEAEGTRLCKPESFVVGQIEL